MICIIEYIVNDLFTNKQGKRYTNGTSKLNQSHELLLINVPATSMSDTWSFYRLFLPSFSSFFLRCQLRLMGQDISKITEITI